MPPRSFDSRKGNPAMSSLLENGNLGVAQRPSVRRVDGGAIAMVRQDATAAATNLNLHLNVHGAPAHSHLTASVLSSQTQRHENVKRSDSDEVSPVPGAVPDQVAAINIALQPNIQPPELEPGSLSARIQPHLGVLVPLFFVCVLIWYVRCLVKASQPRAGGPPIAAYKWSETTPLDKSRSKARRTARLDLREETAYQPIDATPKLSYDTIIVPPSDDGGDESDGGDAPRCSKATPEIYDIDCDCEYCRTDLGRGL